MADKYNCFRIKRFVINLGRRVEKKEFGFFMEGGKSTD